jgi:uncharacterized NAD(P)/FAD-binding protein YdhS
VTITHRIAVVGGGASGVLTAINLLAADTDHTLSVTIHEASGIVGRGIAYGTCDPRHLLNVRARHMSAFPDIPSDLLDWAARTGRDVDPQGFLPRMEYAAYLQDCLAAVADHRLTVRAGQVDDVVPTPDGYELHAAGVVSPADAVVLAYGNQRPRPLTVDGDVLPEASWHLPDPWHLAALHRLPSDASVLVVGSGLTAIDTAITVLEEHPARRVTMVSRHGLLPHRHVEQLSTAWVSPVPTGTLTADRLAEHFTEQVAAAEANGVNWRAVVDGLRSPTQSLWLRLDLAERQRFLQEYARLWEVRRHRMAPDVAERIAGYERAGRLSLVTGELIGIADRGARCVTRIGDDTELTVDAVVNCTGPLTDITRSSDPLLLALRERGLASPDPLFLGVASTAAGQLLDPDGRPITGLYAVGSPRKGVLYESTAIPEIRAQASEVARTLLAASARPRVSARTGEARIGPAIS